MMIASVSQQDMALETKSSKEKCGICCIPISARGVLDCCSDVFCFSCIDTWSAFTNLCPLCKLRFKFITFVPAADDGDASDVETQEAFFDFLGQERVENWIDDNEEDGTLSFPSYFIDEDAVVCLDGDGCLVRKELNEKDIDSGLEDISVACDSCDCWYHASCVGYNPDSQGERSWICPRCVGTGVLDLFKFQLASKNLTHKLSSKSSTLDKDGSFTFVDEGETAVVVSMDASCQSVLDQAADQGLSVVNTSYGNDRILDDRILDEASLETAVDVENVSVGPSMGLTEKLSKDSSNAISNVSVTKPEANAFEEVNDQKDVPVEKPSMFANVMQQPLETCLMTPAIVTECSLKYTHVNTSQELVVNINESSLTPSIQQEVDISSMSVVCAQSSSQVLEEGVSNQNAAYVGKVSESMVVECKRASDRAPVSKNLKQELVSAKLQNKLPKRREPPCNLPEKQQREKKKLKLEDRESLSSNSSKVQMMDLQESSYDDIPIEAAQIREPVKLSLKEEVIECSKNGSDYCNFSKPDALRVQEVLKPKPEDMNELRELVQGPAPCHRRVVLPRKNTSSGTNESREGVRTRKIVFRGSALDENVSRIVNEMRRQLKREATALGIVGDDRKVDVTDEKFFVAFKAAIQSSLANPRQQHLSSVQRMALQKPRSKLDGSRQSLMKKLYGGSGKRRQAWDRDWDISFWRENITREKKSRQSSKTLLQQEMAHMEAALQESKKLSKTELESLKSRVYVADTSLLPRQKDIKPLSVQGSTKTNPVHADQSKPLIHVKMVEGAPKRAMALDISNADENQPAKTDKQKWALEVLARKTGQSEKNQRHKGSLLAQLPAHMRPVLEYDRRSKVPTATRQIQLDRFIEHYLQRASLGSVNDNSECQAALTAAMNKEKEIYDRSNSKGVYVNLCVQTLVSLPKLATLRAEETSAVRGAESSSYSAAEVSVEAARTANNDDVAVLMAWKAAGLISDSPCESPTGVESETNTSGMGINLDGCLDSKSVDMGNSSSAGNSHSIEIDHTNTEAGRDKFCWIEMENSRDKETCMQDTLRCDGNNETQKLLEEGEPDVPKEMIETKQQTQEANCDHIPSTPMHDGNIETEKVPEDAEMDVQKKMIDKKQQNQDANCNQHAPLEKALGQEGNPTETQQYSVVSMPVQEQESAMIHESALDVSTEVVPLTLERAEKISKQVELYVKEHIRPLHRSHIITTEQYKWAVTKTTNKVMQHHSQAKSADFLIAEGEKVRRLAEQYLDIYSKHIFPGGMG